ncbi:metallophosphoesterase [Lacticaseibacillus daqingensis]|uniref:metallophosphoesterase n=1 Tax=Lacticaseibacillus daqingensis TaxID=2486014 RepID=UPI000F778784|nr:metallophosphoesterase [Lacticaseibacillus daqingensis]
MKVAFSVDNHVDVNQLDAQAVVARQAAYLTEHRISVYVNAGDTFNDFTKTLAFFQALQRQAPTTTVRFLAGNHDLVNGISYAEAQSPVDPLYLHEQTLALPNTDTVIVGNNGWYDYSLAAPWLHKTAAEFAQWKRAYWIDRGIDQPVSDAERMARVLATTQAALAANAGKRILYATHFVPTGLSMAPPEAPEYWQMAMALMGSAHLGTLLEAHAVSAVVYGHLHRREAPLTVDRTVFYHQPMGYGLRRLYEWQSADWFTEWTRTLVVLDIPEKKVATPA